MTEVTGGLPGTLTPVSYDPSPHMTIEDFSDKLLLLRGLEGSVMWWLGDLLNFAQSKWGEKYTQALEDTGYEYDTLARASYMASRFPPDRRRAGLSFSHHREVADLPASEADSWLDRAETEGLSVHLLRKTRKMAALDGMAAGDPDAVDKSLKRFFKAIADNMRDTLDDVGTTSVSSAFEHDLPTGKRITIITKMRVD